MAAARPREERERAQYRATERDAVAGCATRDASASARPHRVVIDNSRRAMAVFCVAVGENRVKRLGASEYISV
jgi:hypothetical protein